MSSNFVKDATGTRFLPQPELEKESTYRATFNERGIDANTSKDQNKFAKFKMLKESGNSITRLQEPATNSRVSRVNNSELFRTTQEDYGDRNKMTRTEYGKIHSADAPVAMGRSGLRQERGLACSGLTGEPYRTTEDPSSNTFAQRTWMYADDVALTYRRDGVPICTTGGENTTLTLRTSAQLPPAGTTGLCVEGSEHTPPHFGIKSIISGDGVLKYRYNIVD